MQHSYFASALGWFRLVAIAEGISYLILLLIAMPLKYFAGMDNAVKYTGWLHGVLFILFGVLLIKVWIQYRWKFSKVLIAFIASLLPFGTFVLERKLQADSRSMAK
jgi:integral membrane protein